MTGEMKGLVLIPPTTGAFGLDFGWTLGGLVTARMKGDSGGINVLMEGNMAVEEARKLYYSLGVTIRNAEEALATAEAAKTKSLEE